MSCLYDELPVVALDFGSLLVCVGFASRHLLVRARDEDLGKM